MKKNIFSVIILSAVITAAAVLIGVSSTRSLSVNKIKKKIGNESELKDNYDLCCLNNLPASEHSENSIYLLKDIWKDQDDNPVKLENFSGKQVILAMIYTSCGTVCPVIVSDMQKLENAVPPAEKNNYHFILVSIDPDTDTPVKLKEFAQERNLDLNTWTLLTGTKTAVAELAQAIGFRYKQNKNGTFTHTSLITFLNSNGEIINQTEGLNLLQKNPGTSN